MTSIIFGISGQDGHYLKSILSLNSHKVIGVSRSEGGWINGDVSNYEFTQSLIKLHKPDFVFHFAANSTTRHNVLFENHGTISTGTLNILESVRLYCPAAKVFLSGSAMQFKNDGRPISELTAFEASSTYSVARIQSVYAGRYYRNVFGLNIYIGYFFNHDSPLRSENHVNQKIVRAVQRIGKGSSEKLELGNINVQKEFNYAGDIMNAIWTLINQNSVYEAVIGTGKTYSIKDWVAVCFDKISLNWQDYLVIKPDFKAEYQILMSDPQLIFSLGWQPRVDFYQLADLMMNSK